MATHNPLDPETRSTQRERDLAAADAEARRAGEHPLDPGTRAFRADLIAAVRLRAATLAGKRERRSLPAGQAPAHHEARP